MQYWIDQYGFWGYLQHFPVNPITMVGAVVIAGIIVILITAAARKKKANAYLADHAGAALMTFHKKKVLNYDKDYNDYADNIRILTLNGEKAHWFFVRPAVPAIYLKPGDNTLELYADWARRETVVKMYKSEVVTLTVTAETDGQYSLEYYLPEKRYIFEPFTVK